MKMKSEEKREREREERGSSNVRKKVSENSGFRILQDF